MICTQSLQSYGEFLIPANDVGCLTFYLVRFAHDESTNRIFFDLTI